MLFSKLVLATLALGAASARSNSLVRKRNVRRRIVEGDGTCANEGKTEEIYYNIEIEPEHVSEGCDASHFEDIGILLQGIVEKVEADIPEYKEEEYMRTSLCVRNQLRSRRGLMVDELRRALGLYRYRGGGICRRCLYDNKDRRILTEATVKAACDDAEEAQFFSEVANEAIKASKDTVSELTGLALDCEDLSKAHSMVKRSKEFLDLLTEEKRVAMTEARAAMQACRNAVTAKTEKAVQKFVTAAEAAAGHAMDATVKAQELYQNINHERSELVKMIANHTATENTTMDDTDAKAETGEKVSPPTDEDPASIVLKEEEKVTTGGGEPAVDGGDDKGGMAVNETATEKEVAQASPPTVEEETVPKEDAQVSATVDDKQEKVGTETTDEHVQAAPQPAPGTGDKGKVPVQEDGLASDKVEGNTEKTEAADTTTSNEATTPTEEGLDGPTTIVSHTYLQPTLDVWLFELSQRLEERIPIDLLAEYNKNSPGPGCIVESFIARVYVTEVANATEVLSCDPV